MLGFSLLRAILSISSMYDDAALALGDVELAGLEQAHEDVLDILTDVAGFGERGGVGDRERDVENAGERLGQERLADAGGAHEQDVRLVELDVVVASGGAVDALVMIVDGDGERLLRALLPDHVLIEHILDLLRRRDLGDRLRYLSLLILGENLVAEGNALVADVDRRARDELPHGVLGLSAERTTQVFIVTHWHPRNEKEQSYGEKGRCWAREALLVNTPPASRSTT